MPSIPELLNGHVTLEVKALEKERSRRYAMPTELAADIGRYLRHEPVVARPASAAYRARKYIRRHRMGAGVGPAAIAAILVLAVVAALANFARHQNEIERIRWTLQQAIDNPHKWLDQLQPDWSHLESILHDEIRKNPHRDVALLAQRAACRVSVSAASFGRLSQLPDLVVTVNRVIDPGKPFLNVVYLEGALDDDPWEPIAAAVYQNIQEYTSFSYGSRLDSFFPAAELTPTPHKIKFRATFRLFDPNRPFYRS